MNENNEEIVQIAENTIPFSEGAETGNTIIVQAPDYSGYFESILSRLESVEGVQNNFFNDVIDISLFAMAVIIGLFAFKEFMDRVTRW